jgi:hypothetical protein
MKRENRKIRKDNLKEITGNRTELKEFMGKTLKCEVFITNTSGYQGNSRLVTEVKIPGTDWFVKHVWLKKINIGALPHGYRTLELRVVEYKDHITQELKYGFRYVGEEGKMKINTKMQIPKWKQEQKENEKLKKEAKKAKRAEAKANQTKKPFGKIRKINREEVLKQPNPTKPANPAHQWTK